MNTRSIQFRLIAWYGSLIVLVGLALGVYIYQGVQARLLADIEMVLKRRAQQISTTILAHQPTETSSAIAAQIHDVYSPEANSRLIRILAADGTVIYASGAAKDGSFDPEMIAINLSKSGTELLTLPHVTRLLLVTVPVEAAGMHYIIQMGAPTNEVDATLHNLVITLLYGLPLVILIVSAGGYFLVRSALKPVEHIRATAAQITFGNLSNRLPVTPSGDALEHLSVTLNQMLKRLEDAYQQASRFSADASHELRTPLTIMRGELESIVREDGIPSAFRERIGSVLEETERLSRITESLFAISRLDAGGAKIQHSKCDLGALMQVTAEQMQLLADEKSIKVLLSISPNVTVYGDAARLKQIVVNLIDNAIKYTPEDGTIYLTVAADNNAAALEVRDNGVGIPADALPYVFERFYRADKVRSRELGGAGLGLSIVRSIVQAHGGEVEITSDGEHGTSCRVVLPLGNLHEYSYETV